MPLSCAPLKCTPKAKAEAAKKRAREGFGEGDGDWMESDPDRQVLDMVVLHALQHCTFKLCQERRVKRRADGVVL